MTIIEELRAERLRMDAERNWVREAVTVVEEFRDPALLAPYRRAFISPASASIADSRTRRTIGGQVTPGEMARAYLRRVLDGRRAVPYQRQATALCDRRPGYYFSGARTGHLALVDVRACYASIYSRLSLDVLYRPESRPPIVAVGRMPFPARNEWLSAKAPRNAAFGNLLRPRICEWRYGVPVEDAAPNRFFAPDLQGMVIDVTHCVAQETRALFGTSSWAVDGGTIPAERADEWIDWLAERWGLTGEVRASGGALLFGPTSWRIGDTQTRDVEHGRPHAWPATDSIRPLPTRLRDELAAVMKGRA